MTATLAPVPRPATGTVISYPHKDGRTVSYYLRFHAHGRRQRVNLGTNHQGWNEQRARVELDKILAQVERGTWESPARTTSIRADVDETLLVTASRWWQRKEPELRGGTPADYRWRLDYVLADLADEPTAAIRVRRVDEFRDRLVAKGLSARSVNMILDVLAQVLDDAVEYELIDSNPARGRRRRLRVAKPRRSFLEPDQVVDLLDVAGEWEDSLPDHQRYGRRALLALLCLAGPRISEAIAADRGDFDLAGGRWRIPAAKTPAGERDVELTTFLGSELRAHVAARGISSGPMFPTHQGGRLNASNVRNRLLHGTKGSKPVKGVVERANERREGQMLLPRVTPHALRRTFASLALTAGRDPRWVMAQLGHTDARLTLSVYAQVVQRQRTDRKLIEKLMTFHDEEESGEQDRRRTAALD
jgi:integrase